MRRLRSVMAVCRLAPWFIGFGVAKRFLPLTTLVRTAYREPRAGTAGNLTQIASRVFLTGRLTGAPDADCLQRSLLLYRELSCAGLDPELSVGFRHVADRLTGHAWVSVAGTAVGESELDAASFTRVLRFGADGALRR